MMSEFKKSELNGLPSISLPVSVAPLDGKYYGTLIVDANGDTVISIWTAEGEPSCREKEKFNDWTPEAWAEYCCDSHWECEQDYVTATNLAEMINAAQIPEYRNDGAVIRPSFQAIVNFSNRD